MYSCTSRSQGARPTDLLYKQQGFDDKRTLDSLSMKGNDRGHEG